MALDQHPETAVSSPDAAHAQALLDRVKASSDFSRSPRLRQLLDFLCAGSLDDSPTPLTEERIGIEVFGRVRGYDTGTDTIVRVQVSQLRKKLEHYFLSEGADESIVIYLPKRSYTPVFRAREPMAAETGSADAVANPGRWSTLRLVLGSLLAIVLAGAGWMLVEKGSGGRTPFCDHFWSQLFRGGRPTQVVTSDANVMMLCDFLGRTVTPAEYIGSGYPAALISANIADPAAQRVLRSISSNFVTNMPDVRVTNQLSLLAAARGGRLNIWFARDFRFQPQTPDNLIFLSHRKANPWVSLFEERLNFRYEFNAKENRAAVVNLSPQPGEAPKYPVDWGAETYAVIARMRKPVGEGTVLLLGGADTVATEAGCNLLTDETRMRSLYGRLGITRSGPVPDFEVLLRAKQLRGFVREYEIIAHRILSR